MRCGTPQQHVSLARTFIGDAELALCEVAQSAVDELGAPPAGAVCEIAAFDQGHGQATRRCVQGDTDAGDAAADNEQVDDFSTGECVQLATAANRVERRAGCDRRHRLASVRR